MPRTFDLIEPARDPRVLMGVLTVVPMVAALGVVFAVVKPAPPPQIAAVAILVLVVSNLLISRWIDRRRVTLDEDRLEILAAMVQRSVPVADIDLDRARVLRLDEHPEWRPFLRTGGLGMPGLTLGWYRTRALARIFCVLTDRQRVLLLPLRDGKEAVLLSLKRPDELLSALRAANDASGRGR
jgi:hypothetical protein